MLVSPLYFLHSGQGQLTQVHKLKQTVRIDSYLKYLSLQGNFSSLYLLRALPSCGVDGEKRLRFLTTDNIDTV